MSDPPQLSYGGGGDARTGEAPLPVRFRRHADMLGRSGRSPLYIELMRSAADDIEHGGEIARLFEGIDTPPGAVPQLRLTAALLDPGRTADQLTLLSYIWPDELHRIERLRAALSVAARDPVPVARRPGSEWLPEALEATQPGELVVVWHSVIRQYVAPEEWAAIERTLDVRPDVVRLSMEPALERHLEMHLTVHGPAGAPAQRLAVCDDHGLPIRWDTYSPAA